jgi:predicted O-methyltransferase YrrM
MAYQPSQIQTKEKHMNYFSTLVTDPWIKLPWQMSIAERNYFTCCLTKLQPTLALEIGTYQGGSLQVLSKFSKKVISIDIDPKISKILTGKFPNVDFRTGDSKQLLPTLVAEFNHTKTFPDFILVDGDHSKAGVCRDLNALLEMRPSKPITILMHDSFNPNCRAGMLSANWQDAPFVQEVELDLIPGVVHKEAYDTASKLSMWGGFAGALLTEKPRSTPLTINQSSKYIFNIVKRKSSHQFENFSPKSILKRILHCS